jgi:cysteine-rich repeat protein
MKRLLLSLFFAGAGCGLYGPIFNANCGDGITQQPAEECDEGPDNGGATCRTDCTLPICGDGTLDTISGELCDDGNNVDGDGCNSACIQEFCGDGTINNINETCDDGNTINGDGCQSTCLLPECGDGVLDTGEQCEDGNNIDGDGCDSTCLQEDCGDGTTNNNNSEQCDDGNQISGDGCNNDCQSTTIVQVATGGEHTCILTNAGTVKCWGNGGFGRLGYGNVNNIGDDETPANPNVGNVEIGGFATQITAGAEHTCALLDNGNVVCWGNGASGRLGYGNLDNVGDDESPANAGVVNVGGTVLQIAAGGAHTCALLEGGAVRCWGNGGLGRLGYSNADDVGDDEEPTDAGDIDLGGIAVQVAVGDAHSCAVLDNGTLRCWGLGGAGRLGYNNQNNIGDNETPEFAGSVLVSLTSIKTTLGASHSCLLDVAQSIQCWGLGDAGRLGYANNSNVGDNETPASVGELNIGGLLVNALAAGGAHTCALFSAGNVRCWGDAAQGQLGTGNTTDLGDNANETPGQLSDILLGAPATQIAAGGTHNCAILDTGKLRCWGGNGFGQLGYGNTNNLGDNNGETPASGGDVDVFPND